MNSGNRKFYLILSIIIFVSISIIGYISYNYIDYLSKKDSIVSIESIKELARDNNYIDDNFENKIRFVISYEGDEGNSQINNQSINLLLEDGDLYLYSNSYIEYDYELRDNVEKNGKEYKSKISNIDEQVVMIKQTISGACVIDAIEYGILTDKGNLYAINFSDNVERLDDILTLLYKNKDVNLSLKKLNKNELKVLAFTNYYYDDRGNTCTSHPSPIYTNDKVLRDYETFEEVKPIIDYTGLYYSDIGFVVYQDFTISIDNNNLVKNKNNNNLLIKAYYKDVILNNLLILDKENYLYYQDENDNGNIKLYKNVKVKEILKEIIKGSETQNVWDDTIKYTFDFENNEILEIEVVNNEYKMFE